MLHYSSRSAHGKPHRMFTGAAERPEQNQLIDQLSEVERLVFRDL